ncbi:MAG: hypothetical protein NTW87_25770, partial [Planctomycetota bacterium]|nr:hypothetical protein [Planctomycetota bacterium]
MAYDSARLAASIARAAAALLSPEKSRLLAHEIARGVGAVLVTEGRPVPASADIRALVTRLLRETKHEDVADAYAEHARAAASLLWHIRVVEP